jgi:hypothetical protein
VEVLRPVSETYGKPLQYTELDIAIKNPNDPKQGLVAGRPSARFAHHRLRTSAVRAMQWASGKRSVLPTRLWNKDWTPNPRPSYIDLVPRLVDGRQKKTDAKERTRGFLAITSHVTGQRQNKNRVL